MKCYNPFCSKPGCIYETQRGFEQHLSNNKNCMIFMKELILNQPNSNIGYKHNIEDMSGNTNIHKSLSNKRLCNIDISLMNNNHNNLSNNISYELQNILDDNFDINSYSTEQSSETAESVNTDVTMPDIAEPILGNLYTTEQKSIIKLIKLLDDMDCPDYAFSSILSWAHNAYVEGFTFNPSFKSRKSNLHWMKKMVVHNDAFYPKPITVNLNNNLCIDVMCFDFPTQLLHLLQNQKLMTQENLLLDLNHPTKMYESPNNILSEALSGSAYKTVYEHAYANHTGNLPLLVVPICLWGDATHIDTSGRFKLEPWSFSPLIFKEQKQRSNKFWGMLGYIKHLKTTSAQKKTLKKGDTMQMYHKQLSAILASLATHTDKLKNVAIPFNNKVQYFDIVCPILYIIADTEGADKICGRYGSHNLKIQRHCRMCDVDSANLDNKEYNCTYLGFLK